ncbi:MAG: DUF4279 domain-containing protein [Planctomycetota bacterium]
MPKFPPDRTRASFRLMGGSLDPQAVTRMLGIEPSNAHRRGDPGRGRRSPPYREGLWSLRAPLDQTAPLEEHLNWLLDRLEGKRSEIEEFVRNGCRTDFYVGYSIDSGQGGPGLAPSLLRRLGDFGVRLGFDVHMESSEASAKWAPPQGEAGRSSSGS